MARCGAAGTVAVGDFSLPPLLAETASISLRHPLRPDGSGLCRLYRTDPSVCGCGTESAAGIVKSPTHGSRTSDVSQMTVVGGVPARVIKTVSAKEEAE